ncbi:MAG TPA: hypothetical protein VJ793_14170 [Anaerolineae bacterium]|nr:hypothetical protein [Anaerolineae bacterium]
MRKMYSMTAILIAAALGLSACPGSSTPVPTAGAATTSAPENANDNAPGTSATTEPGAPQSEEAIELSDVTEGLSGLDSYATTFTMSFEGTEAGQPKSWTWVMEESYRRDPPAKRTAFAGRGTDEADTGGFETIEVDGKTYSIFGDICTSGESDNAPEATATFKPSDIIGGFRSSQFVGAETVNGVPTRHYVVDESGVSVLGYADAKAEAWIADPGDFVVKYTFEATGKDTFFSASQDAEGTIRWVYEVSSINEPVDIQAPENCGGAPEDIPIMLDAADLSSFGDLTTYTSPSALSDVVAFYKAEMPNNGWSEDVSSGSFSTETFTTLSFAKEGRTASITITYDQASGTTVLIQAGE